MFRPFVIRPSSGLAWRSKEEQCSSVRCKVHNGLNLGFVEYEILFRQGTPPPGEKTRSRFPQTLSLTHYVPYTSQSCTLPLYCAMLDLKMAL
jgi:hypothetical protein